MQRWRVWQLCGTVLLMPAVMPAWAAAAECSGETKRAESLFQHIEHEWPLRGSGDPVSRYVVQLGSRLAALVPERGAAPHRFLVVRNLAANAFSIGGGYVLITDGALVSAETESEIAAILAHELGHEAANHFCPEDRSARGDSSSPDRLFGSPERNGAERLPMGSLTQIIDPAKEQEADRIAVSILRAAGFDPRAMLRVARRLSRDGATQGTGTERIARLESILAPLPAVSPHDSKPFAELKRLLATERPLPATSRSPDVN